MYLDDIAAKIRSHVPESRIPDGDSEELFRLYAILLRAKGTNVTPGDIHDAWSVWMFKRNPRHDSLYAYGDLTEEIQKQDRVYVDAVLRTAEEFNMKEGTRPAFLEVLFPTGPPADEKEIARALDLYKIMVGSSESLVGRRQGVNTFFLTMNGALLTASGIIVQSSGGDRLGGLGVAVLSIAGAILCGAWRSLITSFGQLNSGKFKVINAIERHLKTAIYAAEWEALGRGEDPNVYRSFTSREIWVPNALLVLHIVTATVALLHSAGVFSLGFNGQ